MHTYEEFVMRHHGYGEPDQCDDCHRPMYGFTRDGALICKPCQIARDGDLVCDCCDGSGNEYGEVGEPCYQCNSTGRLSKSQ